MNTNRLIIIVAILSLCSTMLFGQSAGDYRSFQSGNWSNPATWQRYDGTIWVNPAPGFPTSDSGAISILGTHTITLDMNLSVDQVTVNSTGSLLVAAGDTLTVANGADSVDMFVYGTLNQFGRISVIKVGSDSSNISIENGGLFLYSVPAGVDVPMPNYKWRTGSTCRIDSSASTSPTNLKNQNLANLIINATKMGANGGPNFNDGTVINGDLTVLSTNSLQWRIANFSGGQLKNIYIRGNITVNGYTAYLTATGSGADTLAKAIINVDGNVNIISGTWSLNNSSAMYAEWKIKGNVHISGGMLKSGASGWSGRRTINFCSGAAQSYTLSDSGTIQAAPTTYKVSNGSTVQLNFPLTLTTNSAITLENGTFVTSSTNLLTLPATGIINGGSSTSYVNGPLALTLASTNPTTLTFPIGKGSSYRPVTLVVNQDAATATVYTAEMFNAAPVTRTLPASLLSISSVRHYIITKGTGANLSSTLGATIQLNYGADDSVNNKIMVRVAKDNGSGSWLNLGGSGTADSTGSITSNAFYSFSDFVLAVPDTSVAANPPTVVTTSVSYISTTFASSGGNVTNDGGGAILQRGVCWNMTGNPTISDATTSNGVGAGLYTSSVTGLIPGTVYHLRAYATNNAGTGYGDEQVFSTLAAVVPPTVTTTAISNIQVTTAISGGNVTDWGGDSVTVRGICWNTAGAPTISGTHSLDGSGLGSYPSGMAQLTGGTPYHVRAYATNSAGTGYGNELTYSTQTPQSDTTVIVAQDGSGDYLTVQAAFRAVPSNYTGKWTIFVKKGVYFEKDTLASGKINVFLIGENRDSTIITYNDYADSHGSGVPGTSGSFTIAIDASDFTAKNITFQNTYSPQSGVSGTQAVALRTQGDRHEYINCNILGYQDTYYTWGGNGTGRMYHRNCYIQGTVDFIFGRNIVVFDSCTIHEIRNTGTLTAGSTDPSSKFGYVFRNCTILADSIGYDGNPITSIYLGRPWQGSPRTVFLNSSEPSNLNAGGWEAWNVNPALYAEFNCFGPGSATGSRVNWSSQLTGPTASTYSLSTIFAKSSASSGLILYDWMPADPMSDPPLIFRLTPSAGTNGTISPSCVKNVAYGSTTHFSISPASGYHVDSLYVDGAPVAPDSSYNFTNVTANHTIRAVFATNVSVTINASAGGNGTITPSGAVLVVQGANQHFTIAPHSGYHVDSLFVDGVLVDSSTSYTFHYVTVPHTIRAVFVLTTTFTLTINAVNGSITRNPDLSLYDSATVVQLTAVPKSGFHFTAWSGDTVSSVNPILITMNRNKNITASFAHDTVTAAVQVIAGWNMVSVPVTVSDPRKEVLFPAATSSAFAYEGGYVIVESLKNDVGYWLKLPATGTIQIPGYVRMVDTLTLIAGWNMIGSISVPVDIHSVIQNPSSIVTSSYFGYNHGYQEADTITPGQAYWVKTSSGGSLILSSGSGLLSKSQQRTVAGVQTIVKSLDGFSSITITDAKGNHRTLYLGKDKGEGFTLDRYELPPVAPEGIFDVRFVSQRMAEVYGAGHPSQFPVQFNSAAYPVTVSWNVSSDDGQLVLNDGSGVAQTISGKGKKVITNSDRNGIVIGTSTEGIPKGFSLLQNYPNPFNPETNIRFSVGVTGPAQLEVYNVLGQKVVTLFDDIAQSGQYYTVKFGSGDLAGGVYYYRLQSASGTAIKTMILMK